MNKLTSICLVLILLLLPVLALATVADTAGATPAMSINCSRQYMAGVFKGWLCIVYEGGLPTGHFFVPASAHPVTDPVTNATGVADFDLVCGWKQVNNGPFVMVCEPDIRMDSP